MKRVLVLLILITLAFSAIALAGSNGNLAAAPNSGDGVSDGSGFDMEPGSNGVGDAFGPAPNSGDGVPDGSGATPPSGP